MNISVANLKIRDKDSFDAGFTAGIGWAISTDNEPLIAAAPDLLKMLRDIVQRYSELNGRDCTHHDFACCISSAEAAIAKAEGK